MTRPRFTETTDPKPKKANGRLSGRQYVRFAFYKIDPTWRRLPPEKQADHKRELFEAIQQFDRRMLVRSYSTMGTRADAELMLWQIAETPLHFQDLAAAIMQTAMGAYLHMAYSYLSQTKRSIYEIRTNTAQDLEQVVLQDMEAKYLFVYPFIKTRNWYLMSRAARQGVMDEHIQVGREYPSIRLNTTYSFGIDDYEFIVAFETNEPSDFLDLVQRLRETESSKYTLQDTPLFTCINMRLEEALDALGGPAIARPIEEEDDHDIWVEVGPAEDLADGDSKVVFLAGKQVGLFNVNGNLYAINNRCPHARGPLSDGDVEVEGDVCSVTCPWHYAKFDLASGEVIDGIANTPVRTYSVEVRDGMIYVGTQKTEKVEA